MRKSTAALALLLLSAGGCGVSIRTTPFATAERQSFSSETAVQMFSSRTPDCPYEEIALLRVTPNSALTRWQRVVDSFIDNVRKLGGDAVIMSAALDPLGAAGAESTRQESLSGTVIRFDDAGCRR